MNIEQLANLEFGSVIFGIVAILFALLVRRYLDEAELRDMYEYEYEW